MSALPPEPPGRNPIEPDAIGRPPYGRDPLAQSTPAARPRRRWGPVVWVSVGVVAVLLLTVGTSGTRDWWARRVGDVTGGNRGADYAIGLAIGLLPLVGVALGALGTRGHRRVLRMLVLGAAGFVATYLLAPSIAGWITNDASVRAFGRHAPGYLAGVFTGVGVWVLLLVVAVMRARHWWHRTTGRGRFSAPRGPV